jgi:hypothetical protein
MEESRTPSLAPTSMGQATLLSAILPARAVWWIQLMAFFGLIVLVAIYVVSATRTSSGEQPIRTAISETGGTILPAVR